MATVIENPGEPQLVGANIPLDSLVAMGYNAIAIYATTALSGLCDVVTEDGLIQPFLQQRLAQVRQQIDDARNAGLQPYIFYDAMTLGRGVVQQHQGVTCLSQSAVICPASDEVIRLSIDGLRWLLSELPDVAGVVLRLGDTDASRTVHLLGNDPYLPRCARCRNMGRADRVLRQIRAFYREVVEQRDLNLVVRAWNVQPGGWHDDTVLASSIIPRLPGPLDDERLILSFKFTRQDFERHQPWNTCSLQAGRRPVLYEFQCQREFELKGAIPDWQAPLWQDGPWECAVSVQGLRVAQNRVNLAGAIGWVRGGGWGGPFVRDYQWVDANAWCVPLLVEDSDVTREEQLNLVLDRCFQVEDLSQREVLTWVLEGSERAACQVLALGDAGEHGLPAWVRDGLWDIEAAWDRVCDMPPEAYPDLLREKAEGAAWMVEAWRRMQQVGLSTGRYAPLSAGVLYGKTLFAAMRDLVGALVEMRMAELGNGDLDVARDLLQRAQSHWLAHVHLAESVPHMATPMRERGLWQIEQRMS